MRITRRQFLKYCTASAAALGLSQTDLLKLKDVLATPQTGCNCYGSLPVFYVTGQNCSGCQVSLLNRIIDPAEPLPELGVVQDVADLLVGDPLSWLSGYYQSGGSSGSPPRSGWDVLGTAGYICLEYLSTVTAAAGDLTNDNLKTVASAGPFAVCVDGSIPFQDQKRINKGKEARYCVVGEMDLGDGKGKRDVGVGELLEYLINTGNCAAIYAWGTCASWGGIPAAEGNLTRAMSVQKYLRKRGLEGAVPLVNCPGCPPHPDWMIYPVAWALLYLNGLRPTLAPPLDTVIYTDRFGAMFPKNTPRAIYTGDKGYTVFCEVCPKYSTTDLCISLGTGPGMVNAGDPPQPKEYCTRPSGCNGYISIPDCPTRMWNSFDDGSKNNWCVGGVPGDQSGASYVCVGCANTDYPDGRSPFFSGIKNGG